MLLQDVAVARFKRDLRSKTHDSNTSRGWMMTLDSLLDNSQFRQREKLDLFCLEKI